MMHDLRNILYPTPLDIVLSCFKLVLLDPAYRLSCQGGHFQFTKAATWQAHLMTVTYQC